MTKMHEAGMYHFALLLMMHRVRCILSFKACYITTCVQCTMYIARYTRYFYANSSLFFPSFWHPSGRKRDGGRENRN